MDLWTKKALEVKKAVALQIKAGGSLAYTAKTDQKRKNQSDGDRQLKKGVNQPVNLGLSGSQGMPNPPWHRMGKGLMMACSPVINEFVVPLLC